MTIKEIFDSMAYGPAPESATEALAWIADKGFLPVYGARPLRRLIQREVETPLARMMLSGEAPDGSAVAVGRSKAGGLAFTVRTGGFSD